MPMNELNKRLHAILKNDFYPFLRQYGFITKKGINYRISGDSVAQWIKVEKSRWNTGDMLHFDLDLYVSYGDPGPDIKVDNEMDLVSIGRPTVFRRLCELDNSHDTHFGFYHTTDDTLFANELRERFTSVALPFFEQGITIDGMIAFLLAEKNLCYERGNFAIVGLLYCKKGDQINARRYLMEAPEPMDMKILAAREYGLDLTQPQ